jgi:hypothetical protein
MAIPESKELEILVLTGNGSNVFTCPAGDQSKYEIAQSLEKRKLLRFIGFKQEPIDIDAEKVTQFSTELTPRGQVIYSQLVQNYTGQRGA